MRKQQKNRYRAVAAIILSVVMIFSIAFPINATVVTLPMVHMRQSAEELCCWACAGASVCHYFGQAISTEMFIDARYGTIDRRKEGYMADIQIVLNLKGISSTFYASFPTYNSIKNNINVGSPIVCQMGYYADSEHPSTSHVVLISGYDDSVNEVRVIDSLKTSPEYYNYMDFLTYPTPEVPYQLSSVLYQMSA